MMDYGRGTIKARHLKKMCSKCLIHSHWLSPILLCLYRIRYFIVVGQKLFYVPFKNATIDFIIIIVNTHFLYNIRRMPYFVVSDQMNQHWQHSFRDLLFVMLFTCKISAMQYELAQYQFTYNTEYLV